MAFDMSGRVALVTGAGRGLGRSHALALAARGASIVVNDTGAETDGTGGSRAVADAVVAEIAGAGGTAVASHHDVGTPEGASAAVELALSRFGRLDAVVNNAGILRDRSFGKLTAADFDAVVTGHLGASAYCTLAAWDALKASGSGRVVFTTSASGLYGLFGQANYGAAKAGLVGLMNALKLEGARAGILVNAVAPVAGTRMTEPLLSPELFSGLRPQLVTPVVVYLASEQCAETGLILQTGGGLVSRVQFVETEPMEIADEHVPDEDVADLVAELVGMEPGIPYPSANDALARMLHAVTSTSG
jgi:NAD(P)-dependent dehydrogenase (short-subunit alcohol dehydrogenase family)